jgi:16S rRNA (guanine966-N2)-methyltransferase
MIIIGGQFSSRSIKTSSKLSYRPTKARVRKSVFDSLIPYTFETVLDLFSGSGIMGFEAASRGSAHVTFVENNNKTVRLIKENADLFKGPSFDIIKKDVFKYLDISKKFDLIIADPPYNKYELSLMIEKILNLLNLNGKFILECSKSQKPILGARVVDYGLSRILTWEKS